MALFYTQEDIDLSIKNYSFKSLKNNKRFQKENYIKVYTIDIPKGIYDTFITYFNHGFRLKINSCGSITEGKLSTRIDRKTKKVFPILVCKKAIILKPGNLMTHSPEEAKELLLITYDVFEKRFDEVKAEKHRIDYIQSNDVLRKLANQEIKDTKEIIDLNKKRDNFYKKINGITNKINELTSEMEGEKLLEVCNKIKENNYVIPEEEIERFLCTTLYFEKSAIIQAVTENIDRINGDINK
jgi:hypothetical protein